MALGAGHERDLLLAFGLAVGGRRCLHPTAGRRTLARARRALQLAVLDVLELQLEGLLFCEIELPEDESIEIELPPFVVREVSQDVRFMRGELVGMSAQYVQELIRSR